MSEKEMTEKILRVVSGQRSAEILTALTMATAVIVKSCVKKDLMEEFIEEFKNSLIKSVRKADVTIAIVKMKENG